VTFNKAPRVGPVLEESCSVASLRSLASGIMAHAARRKIRVPFHELRYRTASVIGTRIKSQYIFCIGKSRGVHLSYEVV
jgi:hypothetical protein